MKVSLLDLVEDDVEINSQERTMKYIIPSSTNILARLLQF